MYSGSSAHQALTYLLCSPSSGSGQQPFPISLGTGGIVVSVQRQVGLGVPRGVLLQATTHPESPSQKAVPATECRWPPWRTCCRQPSKRARELSLTPPGRSSGHGYDNMEMLMLVEEEESGSLPEPVA